MSNIETGIKAFIAKIASRDPSEISIDSKLAEDLGVKSVGRIELAALIEDELGIVINNFEIRTPKTVGDVITLANAKK